MFNVRKLSALIALSQAGWGAGVAVRFNPIAPDVGPFPTDALTAPDSEQKTGRRVQLPLPDCAREKSACEDLAIINQYDGFSILPRLRVRFSAPVKPESLRSGIFVMALENLTREEHGLTPVGQPIAIDEVVYDTVTDTVYAKPEDVLDQHRRYALIVTDAVQDRSGSPVEADREFQRCLDERYSDYCEELFYRVVAMQSLAGRFGARRVVAASIFTTLSATAWLEAARDLLANFAPDPRRVTGKSVYAVSDLGTVVVRRHTGTTPASFQDVPVRLDLLEGVGRITYGSYRSPTFLNSDQLIPPVPTGPGPAAPTETREIFFDAFLPASGKPAAGYPVVIAGPAWTSSGFIFPFNGIAGTMARAGYATISINPVGHGFGPDTKVVITERNGAVTEVPASGRAVDMNRDGSFDIAEGCTTWASTIARSVSIPGPFGFRDCLRQTVLDLIQLTRAIRAGIDLDGDGTIDLDASRIYYISLSLGGFYGTILSAVEPSLSAAVLNGGGSSAMDFLRLGVFQPLLGVSLSARTPAIIPNKGSEYVENYALRGQPVKMNDVAGAIEIQNIYDTYAWIQIPGDPIAYAPHLRSSLLPGVPYKRALFQNARGDQRVPNPASSALIRAANMRDWSSLYRHDLARPVAPELVADPHIFLTDFSSPAAASIALAAQQQAARFFAATERCRLDEPCVPDVNQLVRPAFGKDLFEAAPVLPEDLHFLAP